MTRFVRLASHHLDDGTRDLLGKEIAERVAPTELDSDADEAILASIGAHALMRYLPGEVLHGLAVFPSTGSHALLLRNLPRQDFPPTPVSGFADETALAMTNALHFGLIQLMGLTPFAVAYENSARLIRNVVPNPQAAGTTSSWGWDVEFYWHTDNPHLSFSDPGSDPRLHVPRYLTMYAIRNPDRVPTEIAAIEDVVGRLDDHRREQLRAPEFDVGPPASNDTGPDDVLRAASVLEVAPDGQLRVRYDRGTTKGRTAAAAAALDDWVEALAGAPHQQFCLDTGDFLIFDNYRVLHRRPAFTPGTATEARWVRRCYAS